MPWRPKRVFRPKCVTNRVQSTKDARKWLRKPGVRRPSQEPGSSIKNPGDSRCSVFPGGLAGLPTLSLPPSSHKQTTHRSRLRCARCLLDTRLDPSKPSMGLPGASENRVSRPGVFLFFFTSADNIFLYFRGFKKKTFFTPADFSFPRKSAVLRKNGSTVQQQ